MTKTEHYQLNQWDPEDRVTHTDFNADNAKLEAALDALEQRKVDTAALTALEDRLTALQTAFESLKANALTDPGNVYVAGTYTGNGKSSRSINIGFTPKAVLVLSSRGYCYSGSSHAGGLALPGYPAYETVLSIVTNGFQVACNGTGYSIQSNTADTVYYYLAFK